MKKQTAKDQEPRNVHPTALDSVLVPTEGGGLELVDVSFVQARDYTSVGPDRERNLVVLHSTENPDVSGVAKGVAAMFQAGTPAKGSCHVVVDNRDVVQCVRFEDVANGAPGANRDGLHLEMAGYARQSEEQWSDPYSRAVFYRAVGVAAAWCIEFGIPVKWVSAEALAKGGLVGPSRARGITSHWELNRAFHKTNHTDPGPGFNCEAFVNAVRWMVLKVANPETGS